MNKIDGPLISVIVPIYKAEKYIHRCVDSILGQTFWDFELLLIDDGSPDCCFDICDEYAKKDSRVRVFHQENMGVGAVRNLGLEHVIGEYLTFIDSDDYIDSDHLQNFVDNMEDKYDMIVQRIRCLDSNGNLLEIIGYDTKKVFTNDFEIDKEYAKCRFYLLV